MFSLYTRARGGCGVPVAREEGRGVPVVLGRGRDKLEPGLRLLC